MCSAIVPKIITILGFIFICESSVSDGKQVYPQSYKQGSHLLSQSLNVKTSVSKHLCSYRIHEDGSKQLVSCKKSTFCKKWKRRKSEENVHREEWLVEKRETRKRGKVIKSEDALVRLCSSTKEQHEEKREIEGLELCERVAWNHLVEDQGDCTKYFSCQKVYRGTWRIHQGMWPGYFFLEKVSGGRVSRPGARWDWKIYHFMCKQGTSFDGVACREGICSQVGLSRKIPGGDHGIKLTGTKSNTELSKMKANQSATDENKTVTDVSKNVTDTNKSVTNAIESNTTPKKNTTGTNKSATDANESATDANKSITKAIENKKFSEETNISSTDIPKIEDRTSTGFPIVEIQTSTEFPKIKNSITPEISFPKNVRNFIPIFNENIKIQDDLNKNAKNKYIEGSNIKNTKYAYEGSGNEITQDGTEKVEERGKDSIKISQIAKTHRRLDDLKKSDIQKYGKTKTVLLYHATTNNAQGNIYYY